MGQVATKQGRRPYPIIKPAEDMPDMPEYGAAARMASVAGQAAFGLGLQFKRQQEEDKIEADGISALNAQVALDKYDDDEKRRIDSIKFGQIEDFDNAYNDYNKGRQAYINTLLSGKNEDVKQSITDHALKTELSSQSRYYNQLDRYKTQFAQTQFFENQQQIARGTTPENIKQQKAAMLANIDANKDFFTPAQVNSFKVSIEKNINNAIADYQQQAIFNEAQRISQAEGWEKAHNWVMNQKIDTDTKRDIVSDIKFEASQQQLEYDKYVEKIEQDFLSKLRQEKLTEDEVMNSTLEVDKKQEWLRYIDAQVKERLEGEVELNYGTYDRLVGMIEDYDKGKISKDEVRQEISKAVGKDIPTTIARSLRDKLATKDKPDDPMNKASAKRAMGMLTELKNADFFWPEDEDDDKIAKRQNHLNYLNLSNELEQWITANPDVTDEQINDKVKGITEQVINVKVPGMIEEAFNYWTQSPFGVFYRKARGIEKEGKADAIVDLSHMTDEEIDAELEKLK